MPLGGVPVAPMGPMVLNPRPVTPSGSYRNLCDFYRETDEYLQIDPFSWHGAAMAPRTLDWESKWALEEQLRHHRRKLSATSNENALSHNKPCCWMRTAKPSM